MWSPATVEVSNMTCFLCLQLCESPSPCGLCHMRCHPACLGDYVTKCCEATCPQCGVRLKKGHIMDGFKALLEQHEAEFGALHEKTIATRLDLAVACATFGESDAARGLFDEVQGSVGETGRWLQIACQLEKARHLAKTNPSQARQQA